MTSVPVLPETAPFTPEQRAWLNGFFAGLFNRTPSAAPANPTQATAPLQPLTILYGTQTGTAESLAKRAAKEAGKRGFAPAVLDMAATDPAKLAGEKNVLVVVSTYGDGEPPDNAKALHAALASDSAPLAGLRYSVCALGDSNYTQFCQCGRDFDTRLEQRGAHRIAPRVECDVDYEQTFTQWLNSALAALGSSIAASGPAVMAPSIAETATPSVYSKANPFAAPLLTRRTLNASGSAKEVNHIELSLAGSGLTYEAGDALGVLPRNCPQLVDEVLATLGFDGEEAVTTGAGELPLRIALQQHYDLGKPPGALLTALGLTASPELLDVLDGLRVGARTGLANAGAFVALLRKLQPRLYSISSSPRAHPDEVHLTVGAVRYEAANRRRKGVCSTFLADRCAAGETTVPVFVHANSNFRLPADGSVPVIMVGPGTGIAPFRAFLEERRATGASGRNWLFFGDQREATDFLYRDELVDWHRDGLLTRLDLAWSRDQQQKVYVQQRMREHAAELFSWLEAGAHLYVCGDASRMAKDVDAALHDAIATAGGRSTESAAAYVQALKAAKRYQRDVY